ncbi:hypothetical protein ACAG26_14845 [Mycobacterium sp. pUA109]|uniref:hypothetical protein n=1 Tax=Mycobacterium sp. pUA109 TaxID=3238982 RepID=UPI00351BB712
MTAKRRRATDAEYEELADSYAAEPIRADEVRWMEIGPGLPKHRPDSSKELRDLINEVAAAAEAAEADQTDRPLPPHVKVSRPGRARSRVLQVRLNPDELEALERIAERRELPVSTVAREQLLRYITAEAQAQD